MLSFTIEGSKISRMSSPHRRPQIYLSNSAFTIDVEGSWRSDGHDQSRGRLGEQTLRPVQKKKGSERFRTLMSEADIDYRFDPMAEIHCFFVQLPSRTKIDDLEFLRDFILKLQRTVEVPVIEYDGEPQKFSIVLTAVDEENVHSVKRKKRDLEEGGESD